MKRLPIQPKNQLFHIRNGPSHIFQCVCSYSILWTDRQLLVQGVSTGGDMQSQKLKIFLVQIVVLGKRR